MILTHGILRARYLTSFTVPELLGPDAIYQIRCRPRRLFLPGHRIWLEVSSSKFPRFDRNSNAIPLSKQLWTACTINTQSIPIIYCSELRT